MSVTDFEDTEARVEAVPALSDASGADDIGRAAENRIKDGISRVEIVLRWDMGMPVEDDIRTLGGTVCRDPLDTRFDRQAIPVGEKDPMTLKCKQILLRCTEGIKITIPHNGKERKSLISQIFEIREPIPEKDDTVCGKASCMGAAKHFKEI
jgi:hypothetical protein